MKHTGHYYTSVFVITKILCGCYLFYYRGRTPLTSILIFTDRKEVFVCEITVWWNIPSHHKRSPLKVRAQSCTAQCSILRAVCDSLTFQNIVWHCTVAVKPAALQSLTQKRKKERNSLCSWSWGLCILQKDSVFTL